MFTTNMRRSDAIPQSFNRYAYTQNDPVNFTDPSGLEMCVDASCGIGGFGGWGGSIINNGPHFGGPGVIDQAENDWAYRRDCAFYGGCDTPGGSSGNSSGVSADVWIYGKSESDWLRKLGYLAKYPYIIFQGRAITNFGPNADMMPGQAFEIAGGNAVGKALGSILGRVIGALAGRFFSNAANGPGKFAAEDVALGVHEYLQAFRGSAKIGTDFPTPHGLWQGITAGIDRTVSAGGKIHFNLNGVNTPAAFNPSSPFYNTYTSQELRYVLTNHANSTMFYLNGRVAPPPR